MSTYYSFIYLFVVYLQQIKYNMFNATPYYSFTDPDLLKQVGKFIKKKRLELNLTQENLAIKTGLDRTSISSLENGKGTSLITFIQVLRALELLEVLAPLFDDIQSVISPLKLAKLQEKERKYASNKKHVKTNKESEW